MSRDFKVLLQWRKINWASFQPFCVATESPNTFFSLSSFFKLFLFTGDAVTLGSFLLCNIFYVILINWIKCSLHNLQILVKCLTLKDNYRNQSFLICWDPHLSYMLVLRSQTFKLAADSSFHWPRTAHYDIWLTCKETNHRLFCSESKVDIPIIPVLFVKLLDIF